MRRSRMEVGGTRVLTVVVRDVTEQKRIENEQRFLAELGPVLATTLDYEETLSRIAEVAAQGLSDFCIVDLVDEEGEMRRLRVVSRDPSEAWICDALQRIPLDRDGRTSSGRLWSRGNRSSCRAFASGCRSALPGRRPSRSASRG